MTRRRADFSPDALSCGSLTLNRATFEAAGQESAIRLGNKEFQILEMLLRHHESVFPPSSSWSASGATTQMRKSTWYGYTFLPSQKLSSIGANVQIKAVRGAGYLLEEPMIKRLQRKFMLSLWDPCLLFCW